MMEEREREGKCWGRTVYPCSGHSTVNVAGKKVLVRADLNVPMENGKLTDATRIDRVLANVREISEKKGRVVILSHLGRPKNGPDAENSLKPVAVELERQLGRYISFASDCTGEFAKSAVKAMGDGDILLLENISFHAAETKNDSAFVNAWPNSAAFTSKTPFRPRIARTPPPKEWRTSSRPMTNMLADPKRPLAAIVVGAPALAKAAGISPSSVRRTRKEPRAPAAIGCAASNSPTIRSDRPIAQLDE